MIFPMFFVFVDFVMHEADLGSFTITLPILCCRIDYLASDHFVPTVSVQYKYRLHFECVSPRLRWLPCASADFPARRCRL